MNGTNGNNDECGLLPFSVILAASKGDSDAMKIVLQHYQGYIAHLSMKKIRDENTYWGIDEDLRERLQAKLMQAVLSENHAGVKFSWSYANSHSMKVPFNFIRILDLPMFIDCIGIEKGGFFYATKSNTYYNNRT